jgi:hypothetical protein
MFDWFYQIDKKFEGKWKGKGTIIDKECHNKITKKCVLTKLIIKKINEFSFQVYIKNLIDKNYTNLELVGFLNKDTGVLEFQNTHGVSQFYFNNGFLINSYNTNKNKHITTCTIKLIKDKPKPKPKPCPESSCSESSCSESSCSESSKSYDKSHD